MQFANEPDHPDTTEIPAADIPPEGQLPTLGISLHNTLVINGQDTGVGAHMPKLQWIQAEIDDEPETWDGTKTSERESAAAIALTITLIGRAVEVTQ